jgi:hypothetical protein
MRFPELLTVKAKSISCNAESKVKVKTQFHATKSNNGVHWELKAPVGGNEKWYVARIELPFIEKDLMRALGRTYLISARALDNFTHNYSLL